MGPYLPIYDTVGLYPLIFLHIGHYPRQLLHTDCPDSVTPLLAQWAHTSSFMTQWAYTPSFTYTMGTIPPSHGHTLSSLISSLICAVGPYLLIYDTVALYPLIFLHIGHHPRQLLYTDCPDSVPPLLVQWAHNSSFYDTVGLYPSFTYTVSSTLTIYCTQTVQPQFLPYL